MFETASAWPALHGAFSDVASRLYQRAALDAWTLSGRRGVVVLPTGAGKTRVACAAIAELRVPTVPTLCVVPTRILMHQCVAALEGVYSGGIGALGDGSRRLRPITVATMESAYRHMGRIGHRLALLVADEAHLFGHGGRDELLEMAVAPHRLGLTATPLPEGVAAREVERLLGPHYNLVSEDGIESRIANLVGNKRALFEGLFDGDADTVAFDEAGSFMERVEVLVEAPAVPDARDDEDYDDEDDGDDETGEGDGESEVSAPVRGAGAGEAAVLDGAHILSLVRSVDVRMTPEGGLRIDAPRETAPVLATMLERLARQLRARAGER